MHVQAVPFKQEVQLGLGEVVWRVKEVEAQVVAPQAPLNDWEAPAVHVIRQHAQLAIDAPCKTQEILRMQGWNIRNLTRV